MEYLEDSYCPSAIAGNHNSSRQMTDMRIKDFSDHLLTECESTFGSELTPTTIDVDATSLGVSVTKDCDPGRRGCQETTRYLPGGTSLKRTISPARASF